MAKRKTSTDPKKKPAVSSASAGERNYLTLLGIFLFFFGLFSAISFASFFYYWKTDLSAFSQSFWTLIGDPDFKVQNIFGKVGAALGHRFVYQWFGISALIIAYLLMNLGMRLTVKSRLAPFFKALKWSVFVIFWISTTIAWFSGGEHTVLSGGVGFFLSRWLVNFTGTFGTGILLFATLLIFLTAFYHWTATDYSTFFKKIIPSKSDKILNTEGALPPIKDIVNAPEKELDKKDRLEVFFNDGTKESEELEKAQTTGIANQQQTGTLEITQNTDDPSEDSTDETLLEIEMPTEDEEVSFEEDDAIPVGTAPYDPTLDLSKFQLPNLELLEDHGSGSIQINQQELEDNKNRIVETLNNYKIDIQKIKATIGPTVTLYEIVPAAGVRISKIRSLEDDIALSLSAPGIRIIAPIPRKGTIGIEVPNANPAIVSMKTVLASDKFRNSKMELPIALGKTIANETLVADLAKMPHLLMAGATGQGKSVGLNCILTSLLYKKHPSEIKFVLVDPKKVELTLFNKIERHYLAKLPDTEEAIITETTKVIHTLNSLCIEMDNRYELLKNAMVRNLKEYNAKFISRRLNPLEGHRYLPYIVLVIDEFADLIMTAGKEVEMPIARLAQLARAIGIHLIVATQRPSVNVITGIIKANFPARIAFRVSSKIDSRTILDTGGADQLIGMGDMLFSTGNDLIRIQCAFVDTPEVERVTDFIGNQQGYPTAYHLPEYVGEDSGGVEEIDPADRDSMFEDAARIIVIHQQGSASLLQRKLKLGYNRAGRIIDQLEAAGIIGPFEGSKARQVLVPDEQSLEQLLNARR
jgi:DNA segregation ATPase FtsK/SpoIIIE, S-DNA-T family